MRNLGDSISHIDCVVMTDVAGQARRGWQAGQGTASRRGFERKARAEGSRICTEERAMRKFPPAGRSALRFCPVFLAGGA